MARYRIDLRSDIHTAPTQEMRRAMAEAQVGGDALAGEDPTTCELEDACAEMFGREAGLFVSSGTMGNLVSLLAISRPGYSLITDPYTHIVSSEAEGFKRLAGCTPVFVDSDGAMTGDMVRRCLASQATDDGSAVVCVENTHSLRGGKAWGADVTAGLVEVARQHGLRVHIDGARIFNAATATGQSVFHLTAGADTVQICLSKGLGAPQGSVIVGATETIEQARQYRQMLGGGVHKSGIMAAAGLVALRDMPSRMPEDHRRAKRLGDVLCELRPLRLAYPVHTNIVDVLFEHDALDGARLVAILGSREIGVTGPWDSPGGGWIRLVTHYGITDRDIEEFAGAVTEAVKRSRL